jgi:hypothetical protein
MGRLSRVAKSGYAPSVTRNTPDRLIFYWAEIKLDGDR